MHELKWCICFLVQRKYETGKPNLKLVHHKIHLRDLKDCGNCEIEEWAWLFLLGLLWNLNMEDIADFFFFLIAGKRNFVLLLLPTSSSPDIIFQYSLQIFYSLEPDSICSSKNWALNIWPLQILSLSSLSHNLYEKDFRDMTKFKRNIVFPDMGLKLNMLYLEKQDQLREIAFHWNRREMMRLYFISRHTYKAIAHPVDPRVLSTSPHHAKTQGVQPIWPFPVGRRGMLSVGWLCSAGSWPTGWRGPRPAGHLGMLSWETF